MSCKPGFGFDGKKCIKCTYFSDTPKKKHNEPCKCKPKSGRYEKDAIYKNGKIIGYKKEKNKDKLKISPDGKHCVPCELGYTFSSKLDNKYCKKVKTCGKGQGVKKSPSWKSDTECYNCNLKNEYSPLTKNKDLMCIKIKKKYLNEIEFIKNDKGLNIGIKCAKHLKNIDPLIKHLTQGPTKCDNFKYGYNEIRIRGGKYTCCQPKNWKLPKIKKIKKKKKPIHIINWFILIGIGLVVFFIIFFIVKAATKKKEIDDYEM